jgi:hypothetical protein
MTDHVGVRPVLVPPSAACPPRGQLDEALSLLAHAAAPLQSEDIRDLLRVLGTDGTPPCRPDRAAAEAGCSPYTVRRLLNPGEGDRPPRRATASLLAADRLLGEKIRCGVNAALALYRSRLTAQVLHPGTVVLAMDWFGCAPSAAIWWLPDGTSLTIPLPQQQVVRAPGLMRGWCSAQGITTISDLAERAGIPDDLALRLIDADPRFGRLDTQVWTVPDTGRNLIHHAVRRQLAVRPHTVADLHAGIRAALRVRPGRPPPPLEALDAYLHDQPHYRINRGTVRATTGTDAVLGAATPSSSKRSRQPARQLCRCRSCAERCPRPGSVTRAGVTWYEVRRSCAAPPTVGTRSAGVTTLACPAGVIRRRAS